MKPKITKVYKVVKVSRVDGVFYRYSAFVETGDLIREYMQGAVTLPIPGTKLFAFTEVSQAINYYFVRIPHGDFEIWEAEAENAHTNGWFYDLVSKNEALVAFRNKNMKIPIEKFSSSVACDSIKLIEKLNISRWSRLKYQNEKQIALDIAWRGFIMDRDRMPFQFKV